MNKKEILELRKTFRPEACNITRIATCYVTSEKEKILEKSQSFLSLPEEEAFKYFDLLKQALSGTLGKNLYTLKTNTRSVTSCSSEKSSLNELDHIRKNNMSDDETLSTLFESIIDTYETSDNYLIVIAHGLYDIPYVTTDNMSMEDASDEVYSYTLTCICPVELDKPGLSVDYVKHTIQNRERSWIVSKPVTAVLYPAFSDRSTDIHHVLYYTKKQDDSQAAFLNKFAGTEMLLSGKKEQEWFQDIVDQIHEEKMSLEKAKEIHSKLVEKSLEKELTETYSLDKQEFIKVIESDGLSEEQIKTIEEGYDSTIGKENEVLINNLINIKKMVIQTGTAKIEIDSDFADMVGTKKINGRTYLTIPLTSNDILVDGCSVRTEALS